MFELNAANFNLLSTIDIVRNCARDNGSRPVRRVSNMFQRKREHQKVRDGVIELFARLPSAGYITQCLLNIQIASSTTGSDKKLRRAALV